MVGERNGAYDARFPDFAFPDDTRASRVRIADTHHVHARNQHGQSNARRTVSRYLSLRKTSERRSDAELLPWLVRRTRATHQLFGARPIKRSLYDSAMWARRSASTNDGNQRGILRFHARESRAAVYCGRPMLSTPIAFSGACRWNSWFSTRLWITIVRVFKAMLRCFEWQCFELSLRIFWRITSIKNIGQLQVTN